jgi:hypothetical protein
MDEARSKGAACWPSAGGSYRLSDFLANIQSTDLGTKTSNKLCTISSISREGAKGDYFQR